MSQWPGVPQEGVQPPSCRPAHPAAGPYPPLGLQSGLFSVSRLSSSCRSSGPALRGTSSLQAQRTLRAHGWDSGGARLAPSTQPSQSAGCTREGCRGGPHQCWTSRPQPRCPDEPEGDEVGVEEGRTQEGAQQPQDGRARGHVPPPEPGQEGLERSRRCWPAAPHCSPHPALGWACTPGSSRSLARPPPPALPPAGQEPSVQGGQAQGLTPEVGTPWGRRREWVGAFQDRSTPFQCPPLCTAGSWGAGGWQLRSGGSRPGRLLPACRLTPAAPRGRPLTCTPSWAKKALVSASVARCRQVVRLQQRLRRTSRAKARPSLLL